MSLFRRIVESNTQLDEAQNYESMFNDLFKWNSLENMKRVNPGYADEYDKEPIETVQQKHSVLKAIIADHIKWARTYLKKNDRIIWYLRWIKALLFNYYSWSAENKSALDLQPFVNVWFKNHHKTNPVADQWSWKEYTITIYREPNSSRVENWQREMIHFLSLTTCHKIQNHVWTWETPGQLQKIFTEFETEWAEQRDGKIDADPSLYKEIVMQFPGEWFWVDLGRGACDDEAKAMGHCGNVPTAKEGETILSLRKRVKDGKNVFWEPHLTFILDAQGYLGEMKGKANEKPAQKYHQYITALLKTEKIKGLKGGGYAPESNFSMADLPLEERTALIEQKPTLLDMKSANQFVDHAAVGPTAKEIIFKGIAEGFYNYRRFMVDGGEGLPMRQKSLWFIARWPLLEAVFDRFGTMADSEMFNGYVHGPDDMAHDYRTYPQEFEDYDGFVPYNASLYDYIVTYCLKKYGNDYRAHCDQDDLDYYDFDSALRYLVQEEDSNFVTLVRESIDAGYDKGYEQYTKELVQSWLEDGLEIDHQIPVHADFLNGEFNTDDDIVFGINENDYEFRRLLKDDKAWVAFVDKCEEGDLDFTSTDRLDDEWKERAMEQDGGSASTEHFLNNYKQALKIT